MDKNFKWDSEMTLSIEMAASGVRPILLYILLAAQAVRLP